MSRANIAFVQSLYAAFGRGDTATIIGGLAPDVDWQVNGRRKDYPLFGSWKGSSEVEKFFKGVAQHEQATDFSPREFFGTGDRVCVRNVHWLHALVAATSIVASAPRSSSDAKSRNSRSYATARTAPSRFKFTSSARTS